MEIRIFKKIGFIGSGQVASHLSTSLYEKGYSIEQLYSRTYAHSELLANKINAKAIITLKDFDLDTDLIIVSTSDSALSELDFSVLPDHIMICHTSGSVGIEIFEGRKNYGVFYPLQTFSRQSNPDIDKIPFCIEANTTANTQALKVLAETLSSKVCEISSEQRAKLHLAAVFACNFTNAMYSIAEEILLSSEMDFDLLRPLIEETAKKTQAHSAREVQTGPAVRNDVGIMKKHEEMLKDHPEYADIYQRISKIILNNRKSK